jgi:hypothetical protein
MTADLEVPCRAPDEVKVAMGFPADLDLIIDAASPVDHEPVALLAHIEHEDTGLTTWCVAWAGGNARICCEYNDLIARRRTIGEPPPSAIADWVDEVWAAVLKGSFPKHVPGGGPDQDAAVGQERGR